MATAAANSPASTNKCSAVYAKSVLDIFAEENSLHYQCYQCADNIYFFLKQIRNLSPETDLTRSKVLYIYARAYEAKNGYTGLTVTPLRSRTGTVRPDWNFHVVLFHEGQIYDFDHNNEARPVPARQYFQEMFNVGPRQKSSWLTKLRERALYELGQTYYGALIVPALEYTRQNYPEQNLRHMPIEGIRTSKNWLKSATSMGKNLEDFIEEIEHDPSPQTGN